MKYYLIPLPLQSDQSMSKERSVALEHMDPVLEEVEHRCESLGERRVNSAEKQRELLSRVPSVEFAAECTATSLHHFCFSV